MSKRQRDDEEEVEVPSILSQSAELAFPRGGASTLTSLEKKQVLTQATKDVLFEQEAAGKPEKRARKKSKKVKSTENKAKKSTVDHLNYDLLQPGTAVLGKVINVNRMQLVLALADNIDGFVPITNISDEVTRMLEALEESDSEYESDSEDEAKEGDDEKLTISKAKTFPRLSERFHEGQWLRAVVTDNVSLTGQKRIELTIDPRQVNSGFQKEDYTPGAVLQASVKSMEDHGALLNFGTENIGFISKKILKASGIQLAEGGVMLVHAKKLQGKTLGCESASGEYEPVSAAESVDSLAPGALVSATIIDTLADGIVCEVFGFCEGTIDCTHLGLYDESAIQKAYTIGNKIEARVTALYMQEGVKKLQLSVQPQLLTLAPKPYDDTESAPLEAFPIGYIFEEATVVGKDSLYIYLDVGNRSTIGQCHKARVTENADLDMEFKIGSKQRARVLGYSALDNVYILTLDKAQIDEKYLRVEDIPVGQRVDCVVERIVPERGISVKVDDHFAAFVPHEHLSDVRLVYPERKYKIGAKVKGRVLRVANRGPSSTIYVTLKKSLYRAEDDQILVNFADAHVGKQFPGTILRFVPGGALVQFFGFVRAYLPKSEISETFVDKPEDYLKIGQTVHVRITDVDEASGRLRCSMRISDFLSESQEAELAKLVAGRSMVTAHVVQKEKNAIMLELEGSALRGVLPYGQLSDGPFDECRSLLKKIAIGSAVEALVLNKDNKGRFVNLTLKPSLIEDAKAHTLPLEYSDIRVSSKELHGYVKNMTSHGVFVAFGNNLTGLVLPRYTLEADFQKAYFANQTIPCHVVRTDDANNRFVLSMREGGALGSFAPGVKVAATIRSIRSTSIFVELDGHQPGYIDVTEIYDSYDDIPDPQHPLVGFEKGQTIEAKVLGYHDAHNHTFVPVTEEGESAVVELSIKPSSLKAKKVTSLDLEDYHAGDSVVAFVNNFAKGMLWLHVTPQVSGMISTIRLCNDSEELDKLEQDHPIGSAWKFNVESVDTVHKCLDLSTPEGAGHIGDIKVGSKLPAKVLHTEESRVVVDLRDDTAAVSYITDALDDYTQNLEDVFQPGDVVPCEVVEIEGPKIYVSLRSKDAKDRMIETESQLKRGDVVHGFISHIADNGIYVMLGRRVYALVRVTDLSDSFVRDWKSLYHVDQMVTGKIVRADGPGKVLLSLKESEIKSKTDILKRFTDLKVGDIFDGSVRRVTDFGVFVNLDGTSHLSGLCHRSEIAEKSVTDPMSIFSEGDRVKVKILAINNGKKQLSLGMKASYFKFKDDEEDIEMSDVSEEEAEEEEESDSDEDVVDAGYAEEHIPQTSSPVAISDEEADQSMAAEGLSTGFDWTASVLEQTKEDLSDSEDEYDADLKKKKKKKSKRRVADYEDKTAELSTRAPESVSDFERLLLGNPDSSLLWIQYMSFQLQLGEIDKAREIARRALKTINYRDEQDKLNVWIALLNLEVMFGTDESLDAVFKEACQYMDSYVIHQKLASILTASQKFDKAKALFEAMCKKFGYDKIPVWVSFGSYLIDRSETDEAREILARALHVLPKRSHVAAVCKFAQLEFTKGAAEQGRSLFEGLLADVPKRLDLWNVYIDQEIKNGDAKKAEDLFERAVARKLTKKQAKFFFGKWLAFEEEQGNSKAADYVKAKAAEYAQTLAEKA